MVSNIPDVPIGTDWIHYKNGKTYTILGHWTYTILGHCLLQLNNNWVDGVIYKTEGSDLTFVRDKIDFISKFEIKK